MNHTLKCDPAPFDAVAAGIKTHEIRFDDRAFAVGDVLTLRRTKESADTMRYSSTQYPLEYTGDVLTRVVSHVQRGYGLAHGWVILSFATEPDAKRWRKLVDLAGHWQDGSDCTVTLAQDDATRTYHLDVGKHSYVAESFAAALDLACASVR